MFKEQNLSLEDKKLPSNEKYIFLFGMHKTQSSQFLLLIYEKKK